jgi:UDP-2,3-diacylglucosamine hydrolase
MSSAANPLGLIAGAGAFPMLVAEGARAAGRPVVCAALNGVAEAELRSMVNVYQPVGLLQIGRWSRLLRNHGVTEAIMVGGVSKSNLYRRWRWLHYIPDARTLGVYWRRLRHDKRDHAVLLAIVDELAKDGITLIDSTSYSTAHLATSGVMTRTQPTAKQQADIDFGYPLCKLVSGHDIGQSLAVLDKDVLAVEAIEGTDRMIERAGQFCKSGRWTLIKVANIHQDMRIDVPSIGTATIEKLKTTGCGCLVLQAGKTMMLERPKVLELADRYGIVIVGVV